MSVLLAATSLSACHRTRRPSEVLARVEVPVSRGVVASVRLYIHTYIHTKCTIDSSSIPYQKHYRDTTFVPTVSRHTGTQMGDSRRLANY